MADRGSVPAVSWLDEPESHDYGAATNYLSMLADSGTVSATVAELARAEPLTREAKDILRAARLGLLSADNPHVKSDLAKIAAGKKLSPILLVRGSAADPMQIADGYHRVCASYLTDENTPIPCRLVSWVSPSCSHPDH
jgi:hypothetical protein